MRKYDLTKYLYYYAFYFLPLHLKITETETTSSSYKHVLINSVKVYNYEIAEKFYFVS